MLLQSSPELIELGHNAQLRSESDIPDADRLSYVIRSSCEIKV